MKNKHSIPILLIVILLFGLLAQSGCDRSKSDYDIFSEIMNKDSEDVTEKDYLKIMEIFDSAAGRLSAGDDNALEDAMRNMDKFLNRCYIEPDPGNMYGPSIVPRTSVKYNVSPIATELGDRYDKMTRAKLSDTPRYGIAEDVALQQLVFSANLLRYLPDVCFGYPMVDMKMSLLTNSFGEYYLGGFDYAFEIHFDKGDDMSVDNTMTLFPLISARSIRNGIYNGLVYTSRSYPDIDVYEVYIEGNQICNVQKFPKLFPLLNVPQRFNIANKVNLVFDVLDYTRLIRTGEIKAAFSMVVTDTESINIGYVKYDYDRIQKAIKQYNEKYVGIEAIEATGVTMDDIEYFLLGKYRLEDNSMSEDERYEKVDRFSDYSYDEADEQN
jgi:hypothetical protein